MCRDLRGSQLINFLWNWLLMQRSGTDESSISSTWKIWPFLSFFTDTRSFSSAPKIKSKYGLQLHKLLFLRSKCMNFTTDLFNFRAGCRVSSVYTWYSKHKEMKIEIVGIAERHCRPVVCVLGFVCYSGCRSQFAFQWKNKGRKIDSGVELRRSYGQLAALWWWWAAT